MATNNVKGKIYQLDLVTLRSDPGQPRKFMDPGCFAGMGASISRNWVIEPIVFLVEIAKIKTQEAIRKSFEKYMAKQAVQGREKPKKSRASKEVALIRKVVVLNDRG